MSTVATSAPRPARAGLSELKMRLSEPGARALSSDELATKIARKFARTEKLHSLALQDRVERAGRVVQSAVICRERRLRLEAAKRECVQAKLDRALRAESRRCQGALRAQAGFAARRNRFFACMTARAARARNCSLEHARSIEREAWVAHAHQKVVALVAARSACRVKHSRAVASAVKAKRAEQAFDLFAEVTARQEAAEERRHQLREASAQRAAAVLDLSATGVARHLAATEFDRELARTRDELASQTATLRREERVQQVADKAAAANARAARVASEHVDRRASEPVALRHAMAVRLQAAEVARRARLLAKATKPQARGCVLVHISEAGLRPGAGQRIMPLNARLMHRLMARPSLLLATAKARQTRAAGGRATRLALRKMHAALHGCVRVAQARGRRAAAAEATRAATQARSQVADVAKAEAQRAREARAAERERRRLAVASRRSLARLEALGLATFAQAARGVAADRRNRRLAHRALCSQMDLVAAAGGAAMRRLMRSALGVKAASESRRRARMATSRREVHQSEVVVRARLCSTPRSIPCKLTTGGATIGLEIAASAAECSIDRPTPLHSPVSGAALVDEVRGGKMLSAAELRLLKRLDAQAHEGGATGGERRSPRLQEQHDERPVLW